MNQILSESLDEGLYDIPFNFVISSFGAFEGRGWNAKPEYEEALSDGYLNIGVCTEDLINLDKKLNDTWASLISDGIALNKIGVIHTTILRYMSAPKDTLIISRRAWGAISPKAPSPPTNVIIKAIVTYTSDEENPCLFRVRIIRF